MQPGGIKRRSMRLLGHDYSTPGAYFITACTQNRSLLFGRVVDGKMVGNRLGAVVEDCWSQLPDHYDNVSLDAFVLMPNHIHGIIAIESSPTDAGAVSTRHGIPEIVRAFKTFSARKINATRADHPAHLCGNADSTTM